MTEADIMDVVVQYLPDNTTDEALALSQRDVGIKIIGQFSGEVSDDYLDILKIAVAAHVEAAFFYSFADLPEGMRIELSSRTIGQLLRVYRRLSGIFQFILERHAEIDFGPYAEVMGKAQIIEFVNSLELKFEIYNSQRRETGNIQLALADLDFFKSVFNITYFLLLKKERFDKFQHEFNEMTEVLMGIREKLVSQEHNEDE